MTRPQKPVLIMTLPMPFAPSPEVLLVEDEPSLREIIVLILEDLGATVTAVATADEGAIAVADRPWALLLTDVRTPGAMDGLQLASMARQQRPSLNIIVMSGYSSKLGNPLPPDVRFLSKPWSLDDFESLVAAQLLGRVAMRADLPA